MPRGRPRLSGGMSVASDKPRGRMTAYAYFVQTCREEHKKLHPDENVQFQEFSRQCSERWKTMSDKEKKKFQDMAAEDKTRYNKEMSNFMADEDRSNFSGVGSRGRRGRRVRKPKKFKDPNKPKRALSAFFYFANDERPKVRAANPDFSVGEVAKELGRKWNELHDGDKVKYEKSAEDDRARYDRDMKIYRAGGSPAKKMKTSNGSIQPPPGPKPYTAEDDDSNSLDGVEEAEENEENGAVDPEDEEEEEDEDDEEEEEESD